MKKIIALVYAFSLTAMEERVNNIESTKLHLQKLYKDATDEYQKLSPGVKKVNLECADVNAMLGKLYFELNKKNAYESLEWFWRIKVRTQIDAEWLSKNQKIMLADLFIDLEQKVIDVQPESIKISDRTLLFQTEEYNAMSWLLNVVTSKKCSGLEWRALLADSTAENRYLLPKMLYEERLKKIILLYQSGKYGDDFVEALKEFDIK